MTAPLAHRTAGLVLADQGHRLSPFTAMRRPDNHGISNAIDRKPPLVRTS